MNANGKNELPISALVDEVFKATSTRVRIELAASAIAHQVNQLDILIDERDIRHEQVESAGSSALNNGFQILGFIDITGRTIMPSQNDSKESDKKASNQDDDSEDEAEEDFSPIEMADLALQASIDGIRAAYRLTLRQANKAIRRSRKSPL